MMVPANRCANLTGVSVPKIEISELGYSADGAEILKGIAASVPAGEITAIVGPSGAGKSTLLRTINRLIEPSEGEIFLDGRPTSNLNPTELRRRVGMVFQLPTLYGETVEEGVLYGARLAGKQEDAGRLLEMVGLEGSFAGREPDSLSVGQQQRASIARALAVGPEVLLMDEPTSSLDDAARDRIEELIKGLKSRLELTIVLVSHELEQVRRVADRVIPLENGRCRGEWPAEEFFAQRAAGSP